MLQQRGLQPAPLTEPEAPDLPPPTPPTPTLSVPSAPSRRGTGLSSCRRTTSSSISTAEDDVPCAVDDIQAPPGTPEEEDLPDWWDDVPGQEPLPEFQLVRLLCLAELSAAANARETTLIDLGCRPRQRAAVLVHACALCSA